MFFKKLKTYKNNTVIQNWLSTDRRIDEAQIPDSIGLKGCDDQGRFLKKAAVTLIFHKDKKEGAENYRPMSFSSVPRKMMAQINLENICKHIKVK